MKGKVLLLAISLLAASSFAHADAATDTTVTNDVTTLLTAQSKAWNKGDLDAFLSAYQKSNDISFVSGQSQVYGFEAVKARYVKRYGTSKSTMGKLTFSALKVQTLGAANALCIGHWRVDSENGPPMNGVFSLVLTKEKTGWKIIHDHTSLTLTKAK